jgi:hypothetical protein
MRPREAGDIMTTRSEAGEGQPGLAVQRDGTTAAVLAFDVAGGRVKHIWSVFNPEKLRPWTTA